MLKLAANDAESIEQVEATKSTVYIAKFWIIDDFGEAIFNVQNGCSNFSSLRSSLLM